jgi:hypothetical protein
MSITTLFKRLGAPLANSRWSWGGVKEDGSVVLRVWQDEAKRTSEGTWMRITAHREFANNPNDLGYAERCRHVELIRAGAPCYLVICVACDTKATPRSIKSFDATGLRVGGAISEMGDETWIQLQR